MSPGLPCRRGAALQGERRAPPPPDSGCSPPGVVGGEGALGGATAACLQEGRRRGAGRSSPSSEIPETMWTRFRLENGV